VTSLCYSTTLNHVTFTALPFSAQAIKTACETSMMGDQLSPGQLAAADDLYHLRIPARWLALSYGTAPPPNQALATWLTELNNRSQHLEKILVLVSSLYKFSSSQSFHPAWPS
jgi:uncharacterized membrane protein YfbV (UPF0208 family)